MKFFVNFLSAFRIAAAFAMIPTLMYGWYLIALIIFILGASSDFFDGWLARKYNVCSKIGGVMDHIGDKLLVVNTLLMLMLLVPALAGLQLIWTINFPTWSIIVPIILMVGRELYISGLREFLGTQKIEMPVPKARFSMGKIKTTLQMISVGAFLLFFAIGTMITPETISRTYLIAVTWLSQIGVYGLWISLVASLLSAAQYTVTFSEKLKKIK